MNYSDIKFDCLHFKGHIPCKPNKLENVTCNNCTYYSKVTTRVLIIKLGAIGDVIRTTPLLEAFEKKYDNVEFYWVTDFPDILPCKKNLKIFKWNHNSVEILKNKNFQIGVNLDKEEEACILLNNAKCDQKFGFSFNEGHIVAVTDKAQHKILTGCFDNISKANTKSYLEEIFEICHLEFRLEEYTIRRSPTLDNKWEKEFKDRAKGRPIIGLNTGCGPRWKTRLWSNENWLKLINSLSEKGYFPVVLGGPGEHEKNIFFSKNSSAYYPGHYSLEEFISISNQCDLIVTQVSLMMHVAVALKKKLVLMNNIFNSHEFELYNRGVLVQPSSGCDCFYGAVCSRELHCMLDISPLKIKESIISLMQ